MLAVENRQVSGQQQSDSMVHCDSKRYRNCHTFYYIQRICIKKLTFPFDTHFRVNFVHACISKQCKTTRNNTSILKCIVEKQTNFEMRLLFRLPLIPNSIHFCALDFKSMLIIICEKTDHFAPVSCQVIAMHTST